MSTQGRTRGRGHEAHHPPRPTRRRGFLAVVADAFSFGGTRGAGEELAIVRGTWAAQAGGPLIELVAEADGVVAGHVQVAPGRLGGIPSAVAGVAPVCVGTVRQGQGIGSALMGALIDASEERRWPLLVLLGGPAYYRRFGFGPAGALGALGLGYAPAGAGNPNFQARRLGRYAATPRGEFSYCWE